MDTKIEEIINNVNESNIAKLGIMLADADAVLFEAQTEQLKNEPVMSKEDSEMLINLIMAGKLDEVKKKQMEIADKNKDAGKQFELKIADAKKDYRQTGIAFDVVKLIVENRKVQITE